MPADDPLYSMCERELKRIGTDLRTAAVENKQYVDASIAAVQSKLTDDIDRIAVRLAHG